MDMAEQMTMMMHGLRGDLKLREPMSRHTSWRVGGPADRAYFPADLDDLAAFLSRVPPGEPLHVVGLGSNLLVRDGGLRGTVVFTHGALQRLELAGDGTLYAEAGVASPKVARFASVHDYHGAEFLAGIPGTIGGALAMNAGCYGSETWEWVTRVLVMDRRGVLRERDPRDYEIAYRHCMLAPHASRSSGQDEEWFAAAWFRFERGDGAAARERIKALLSRRIASQPLGQPNAGSVFRNPPGDHAARLIESCGLKGHRIGGAVVSGKHANFIVNEGGARAADVEALIAYVQETVGRERGVLLEREVRVIGDAEEVDRA
ncbi:MAG: UDP-N-acetylmuramate dehydrogenase [Betaproteobacteria bacterium]|nr:UDP-N-acetylmuramate dehydrogenase [Betaproteobacteria bacterium]